MSVKTYKQRILDECVSLRFYRDVLGEFVGTFLLVSVQAALPLSWEKDGLGGVIQVALGMGFVVFSLITVLGDCGGAHLNPAVTVAMAVCTKATVYRACLYTVAQCIGGITGAALISALTPGAYRGNLAATTLHPDVTLAQGLFTETWITFILVFCIHGATTPSRATGNPKGVAPLAIGLSVALGIMCGFAATGGSMNPARSLGPAVVTGIWDDHWVYWVGPIFGGCLATLVFFIVCVEYNNRLEDDCCEEDPCAFPVSNGRDAELQQSACITASNTKF